MILIFMTNKVCQVIKWCLLSVLTLVLVVACSGKSPDDITAQDSISPPSATRLVKHALGETLVPANPHRLVTLNPLFLGNALALGVKPIGSTTIWQNELSDFEPYLQRLPGELIHLGSEVQGSLEKILSVKPDLLVCTEYYDFIYDQLSQIAPTVVLRWDGTAQSWKKTFLAFGEAIGKSQEAEEALNRYYQRAGEFKQKMKGKAAQTQVSVISVDRASGGGLIYDELGKISYLGDILEDAGLSPLRSQRGGYLSLESLSSVDGDVIFIRADGDDDRQREKLKQLQSHSLWSRLDAVQQGRVYKVGRHWFRSSIIDANMILDDLFRYLLEEEP